ncbi:MAG: dTDP-4-dehydrorhamnose 3,5-epimerase [Chlamydiae bacterium]|nr:dTDP-4-dehydrorhamnose 3,5-epimerase [Chlamydiota bacterium]
MIEISDCELPEVKRIQLRSYSDDRGFFIESYRSPIYKKMGIDPDFLQDNHSFSKKGTIRGMHFQSEPGQSKLISVIVGTIYDVFVDIRPHSATFGKWGACELAAKNHEQLFIPVGFAHGFAVLSEEAHIVYKVSNVFNPETEKTFCYDDPDVGIVWPIEHPILSEKDRNAPCLKEVMIDENMDLGSCRATGQCAH